MRILSKEIKMNPETFAPEMILKIAMTLELAQDIEGDEQKAFKEMGERFVAALSEHGK